MELGPSPERNGGEQAENSYLLLASAKPSRASRILPRRIFNTEVSPSF
jgi:hypothetical protein